MYSTDIQTDCEQHGNIILIRGTEQSLLTILKKTIIAIQFFKDQLYKYDYVIRSNVSSIINFSVLEQCLTTTPVDYGSTLIMTLNHPNPAGGITDNTLHGTRYANGTDIIFSIPVITYLLDNASELDYSIVDDVSIALLLSKKYIPTYIRNNGQLAIADTVNLHTCYFDKLICYRNWHPNRDDDVKIMKYVTNVLRTQQLKDGKIQ